MPITFEHLERRFRQLGLISEMYINIKNNKKGNYFFSQENRKLYREINMNIVYSRNSSLNSSFMVIIMHSLNI